MKTDTEYAREEAISQYIRRVTFARGLKKIDNEKLNAGEPMFFYCRHCGVPTECLPEDYLFTPYSQCSQCKGLEEQGWLNDARRMASRLG